MAEFPYDEALVAVEVEGRVIRPDDLVFVAQKVRLTGGGFLPAGSPARVLGFGTDDLGQTRALILVRRRRGRPGLRRINVPAGYLRAATVPS